MTFFSQLAASARAAHSSFFGTKVLLTEPGTTERSVPVVLGDEKIETRREDNRELRVSVRECRFTTLTSVRHDATVKIAGVLWSIDHFMDRQASGLTVQLRRSTVHTENRPSYRGKG